MGRLCAVSAIITGVLGIIGCHERERPDRLHDPSADDPRWVLSGSFRAPARDAGSSGGTSGGAGAANCLDAGGGCDPVTGGTNSGTSGSGTGASSEEDPTFDGPVTVRQTYTAVCEDSTVQWGFFTCAATTPGDSSIRMRVRTAPTEDTLPAATFRDLLTVSTELGTDRCTITGPAPCPVDLFVLLGGAPLAHQPRSELEVVLNPSSDERSLPTIDKWQLTYSCTFNQ